MTIKQNIKSLSIITAALFAFNANAQEYVKLQNLWDHANYQIKDKEAKKQAFINLDKIAEKTLKQYPNNAEVLAWSGIIKATEAGVLNNLSSLGLLKEAKALLEKSIKIKPDTLNYSATTSLGSLYYLAPSWPIGFKDEDKAQELLSTSLKNKPIDIDANYFYADFLLHTNHKSEAFKYFTRALNSPIREGRELADNERKKQIKQLLAEKFK